MGLFGKVPEKLRVVCRDETGVDEDMNIVCKVYQDDEEVSTVKLKVDGKELEFEATNPKYLGMVLRELKKNGVI